MSRPDLGFGTSRSEISDATIDMAIESGSPTFNPASIASRMVDAKKEYGTAAQSNVYDILTENFDKVFTAQEQDEIRKDMEFARQTGTNLYDDMFMFGIEDGKPHIHTSCKPIAEKLGTLEKNMEMHKIIGGLINSKKVGTSKEKFTEYQTTLDRFVTENFGAPDAEEQTAVRFVIEGNVLETEYLVKQEYYFDLAVYYCVLYKLINKFSN